MLSVKQMDEYVKRMHEHRLPFSPDCGQYVDCFVPAADGAMTQQLPENPTPPVYDHLTCETMKVADKAIFAKDDLDRVLQSQKLINHYGNNSQLVKSIRGRKPSGKAQPKK